MHRPLRLTIDSAALVHNWRWLADRAGVPAGAAIKADARNSNMYRVLAEIYRRSNDHAGALAQAAALAVPANVPRLAARG